MYYEPRSKYWYDEDETDSGEAATPLTWSGILLFPVHLVLVILIMFLISVFPLLLMIGYGLWTIYKGVRARIRKPKSSDLVLVVALILLAALAAVGLFYKPSGPAPAPVPPSVTTGAAPVGAPVQMATAAARHLSPAGTPAPAVTPALPLAERDVTIVADDFSQQPVKGQPIFFYNRLEGDRGALNNSKMDWGHGQVTVTIAAEEIWGGGWMSLNHPRREGLSINFSAILPPQILPPDQSQITGITVLIARSTPGRIFRVELKDHGSLRWANRIVLDGRAQDVSFKLPALGEIDELVWVLDHAAPGDFVVLDSIAFTATTQITDTATAAFVWSLAQLLANADPASGLVRDRARDASGEFDAVPATGGLAAAVALAAQLGIITHEDAVQIVSRVADTLLNDLPRFGGLWPHWVKTSAAGAPVIVPGTEWSSVDSVIAAIGLLTAQQALGLDTSGTEAMLRGIAWSKLMTPGGISHGYTDSGELIPYAWDAFGGEAFLVALAYAAATGQVAPMAYPAPPTATGSGFIDELAFLYVPPPSGVDHWGTNWPAYRSAAADRQISYFRDQYPTSCYARLGLFSLSAAEVPAPSLVAPGQIYQAYGLGGPFAALNDGAALHGAPAVAPHYAAMIASLRPEEAIQMWDWLIRNRLFTPLTNVESLMFPQGAPCDADGVVFNSLKGSWNGLLATLGWGRYLAQQRGEVSVLWQAATVNSFLRDGYRLLAPGGAASAPTMAPTLTPVPRPQVSRTPFAAYAPPPPSETPIAASLDTNLSACAGKPLYLWRSPGRYEYERDGLTFRTVAPAAQPRAPTVPECPNMRNRWEPVTQSFGDRLSAPPVSGVKARWSCESPSEVWIHIGGTETVTTTLGVFQALKVEGSQGYDIYGAVGRIGAFIPHIEDQYRASEWWVSGYGLVRVKASHSYEDQGFPYSERNSEADLVSVMPFAYYESAVRVILADMQLAGIVDACRARISDADVREALRRWDAGARVVNNNRFERKVIDGKWQIVYAGTELPVDGLDIGLNDRPQ